MKEIILGPYEIVKPELGYTYTYNTYFRYQLLNGALRIAEPFIYGVESKPYSWGLRFITGALHMNNAFIDKQATMNWLDEYLIKSDFILIDDIDYWNKLKLLV
jgi:hypothetical protein